MKLSSEQKSSMKKLVNYCRGLGIEISPDLPVLDAPLRRREIESLNNRSLIKFNGDAVFFTSDGVEVAKTLRNI